jgi:probable HAF family extracellular repeat protein
MLSGANSELQAINEVGQVFGACWYNGMPGQWGFIITPDNGVYFRDANGDGCNDLMVDIGNLGGATCTSAYDINDNGVAVGLSVAPLNMNYAYRYENGQMYDLNLSTEGCAYGINNRKQIVGQRATGVGTYKAWQWENGVSWLLGELPGGICSQAYAINEAGIAAGWSTTSGNADESMHAVIWDDGPVDLGQLGGQPTIARAINADARVVGSAHSLDYLTESAFLWEGGVMYGLDDLVSESADWRLTRAEDVNDNGWVVGGGINPDGLNHAYLLSTVPEPGSLAMLLGIALTVLLYWCRKRAA